jgi:ubiquinone/menaquinone biosynthesis C-methylase UbiE
MDLEYQKASFLYRIIDELGNNRLFSFIYKKHINELGIKGNETILDFGCGSGAGSRHLAKKLNRANGYLTCVDISEYWMAKAKRRMRHYNNVDFLIGQLPELQIGEKSFDIVYIFYALHEVPKKLRSGIVSEFFRVMKNNGRLLIKEPQRENDGMPIDEIEELMKSNGFYRKNFKIVKGTYSAVYKKAANNNL